MPDIVFSPVGPVVVWQDTSQPSSLGMSKLKHYLLPLLLAVCLGGQ